MHSMSILAYIDAGTGSLVLQFLIGGLLGLLFIGKVFWRNILAGAGRLFGRKPAETGDEQDGAAE